MKEEEIQNTQLIINVIEGITINPILWYEESRATLNCTFLLPLSFCVVILFAIILIFYA